MSGSVIVDELRKQNQKLDLNNQKLDKLQATMEEIKENTKPTATL